MPSAPTHRLPSRALCALALLLAAATPLRALNPTEWRNRQPIILNTTGPLRIPLPIETLDAAQPGLADFRILGPDGAEIPYALIRPTAQPPASREPASFRVSLETDATVITVRTGSVRPLDSLLLQTGAPTFLKPAKIEISADGRAWQTIADGVPFFQQDGARQTALPLDNRTATWLRITLADRTSPPITVTGALLRETNGTPAPEETRPARIVSTEEFAGQTVLTIDTGAANLALTALEIDASDPVFARQVTLATREIANEEIVEHPLATAALYRRPAETPSIATGLALLPIDVSTPSREIVLHIDNGDSPPLHLNAVHTRSRIVFAAFVAPTTGRYELLAGNPLANTPRYDLSTLSSELARLPFVTPRIEPAGVSANYRPSDPLAGISLNGASLDATPWNIRRAVTLTAPGVQQLELDPAALAGSLDDFADLRLLRAGKQIPYILERTTYHRTLPLIATDSTNPLHPSISRWKITLPLPRTPITRLQLTSPNPIFQRELRLLEIIPSLNGNTYNFPLAESSWTRTPGAPLLPLSIPVRTRPATDTLWLETENGDNPPITLGNVTASHPVVRLLFRSDTTEAVELTYGYAGAASPRYDLKLVAPQLLRSAKNTALLSDPTPVEAASASTLFHSTGTRTAFWIALALAVILLLVVVAKLLPKPSP